jgi:tRNA pseudouridine55 synthase
VYKPVTWTSFDVIRKLKRYVNKEKIGHAGTLDPAAEGLLLVCVGKNYTRQSSLLMEGEKEYLAEITFGVKTDSYDRDGLETYRQKVGDFSVDRLKKVISSYVGTIEQIPPMYSAKKVDGVRLYKHARKGVEIERKASTVTVRLIDLLAISLGDFPVISCRILCSKGTYIRSLAFDFGEDLGVGAYLSKLKRTRVGDYNSDDALTIEELIGDESY